MQKPEWLNDEDFDNIALSCLKKAIILKEKKVIVHIEDLDVFQLSDLLITLELEKLEKNLLSDNLIYYNDEIISIEDVGELDVIDISVSGDNLFYCNNILTKNSFGLPATADLMFALISTEELEQLGQLMVKQLKNRYADPSYFKRFVIGVDRSKMKLYDLEPSAQHNIHDSGQEDKPVFDNSKFGSRLQTEGFKF